MNDTKIIFLDIDGVLNKMDIASVYDELAIRNELVMNLNEILNATGAKIVIISNWLQIMELDKIVSRLTLKGLNPDSVIDCIKVNVVTPEGNLSYSIKKDKFIISYIFDHNITSYVIIDDTLASELLDGHKMVSPITNIGLTSEDVENAIEILDWL